MKKIILLTALTIGILFPAFAKGPDIKTIGASPQAIGDSGIAWYTTWDTAMTEAKRSQRPMLFMSAAAQCSGISGIF